MHRNVSPNIKQLLEIVNVLFTFQLEPEYPIPNFEEEKERFESMYQEKNAITGHLLFLLSPLLIMG